jgi:hypothetical protein
MKRNGPLPVMWVIWTFTGVLASRSGSTGQNEDGFASAVDSSGNGFLSRNWMTLSDAAVIASVTEARFLPNASIFIQRSMLATASRASTGAPSWKIMPSRNVSFQVLPSFSIT